MIMQMPYALDMIHSLNRHDLGLHLWVIQTC